MRLIDADVVVTIQTFDEMHEEWNTETMTIAELLGSLSDEGCPPIIEAEPVRHGRWINPRLNKYGHPCHQCNQCLFVASQKDRHFCPDCGVKMDGGAE